MRKLKSSRKRIAICLLYNSRPTHAFFTRTSVLHISCSVAVYWQTLIHYCDVYKYKLLILKLVITLLTKTMDN